ncbi:hypothetical protein [Rossellomorea aquimaris]|nr:hypothetical protein [Rossellomorea aquimaris]
MSMKDFREIEEEMKAILSSGFKAVVMETTTVPSVDESDITYPNL